MAFSGSSYFFGIGTAFAAIAVGFAGGAMITTSAVQPPNRLERVSAGPIAPSNADAPPASTASSRPEQSNTASRETSASSVAAAPAADPQPAPQPTAAVTTNTEKPDTKTAQEQQAAPAPKNAPAPVARSDDPPATKSSERTTVGRAPDPGKDVSRSANQNKEFARKRADDRRPSDDRKFSERRRRQDQQDQDQRRLDEASNVVRQMPRGEAVDEMVEVPRFAPRQRRFGLFGDDDGPRVINEPRPRFGFFGDD